MLLFQSAGQLAQQQLSVRALGHFIKKNHKILHMWADDRDECTFFLPIIIFISIAHIPFAEITSRYAQKHSKVGFLGEISAAPRYNCMLLIWHQTTWNNKCNLSFSFELHFTKECHEKHSASENAEPLECARWGKAVICKTQFKNKEIQHALHKT